MAARVGGPWLSVGKVIELFVSMGCVLNSLPGHIETSDGAHRVRYLYSPEADDFVSLSDLENDDILPPSVIDAWERRLGVTIPRGDLN